MNNIDIQDKIDNYLLNRMTDTERLGFETEMASDTQLKETVELQRLLVIEIKQRAFISGIIKETEERMNKTRGPHITFRQFMIVSWSAAAIFIGAFFVNQAFVNSRMDNLYSQYYASPETDVMRSGEDNTEQITFIKAVELIQEQPEQALTALHALYSQPDSYTYYEDVRWYLSLTELKMHHKSEAKKYLNELVDSEFYGAKASKLLEEL
jgi:hypothetical protein